jgi:hypothetical protein
MTTETTDTSTLYCYIHPARPTSLRCKRCERPICASCAVRTPTGYLCKNCVREHQKNFDTAFWYDYVLGFITTFILSSIASGVIAAISSFLGFYMFFLAAAIAGGAGTFIANIGLRAIGRRRSKPLFIVCAIGAGLGVIPSGLFLLFTGNLFALISLGIYAFIAIPVVYTRLAGIQL